MANMRAYEDGNRLVIVIENPETSIMQLVKALLSSRVPCIEHLGEPPAMKQPALNFSEIPEITPQLSEPQRPKFVQRIKDENTVSDAGKDYQIADNCGQQEIRLYHAMDICMMSIFELRSFILQKSSRLQNNILIKELHTDNLDFILYTKSESVLRKIALQIAG